MAERLNVDVEKISREQLLDLISSWENEFIKLDKMILMDASKEFDVSSRIGFGMDGDEQVRDADFAAVRGAAEENKFITGIKEEMEQIEKRAASLRKTIESWKD
jgi:hypothetical protein